MTSPGPCRSLRRIELDRRVRFRRLLRLWTHTCLARTLGPALPLEWILRRGRQAISGEGDGFAVPVPLALARFGDSLLLEVPTASIHLRLPDWVSFGVSPLHLSDYFLGGGNWGEMAQPITESPVFLEAKELAEHELDFRSTPAFGNYLKGVQAGTPMTRNGVRLDSQDLVEGYFERFVALFRSIQQHGVRRLRGLPEATCPSLRRGRAKDWGEREIGIAIGATGEIFRLPGGQHRTAIAMVLGVATLPVQVRLVHVQWLRSALAAAAGDMTMAIRGGVAGMAAQQGGARRD